MMNDYLSEMTPNDSDTWRADEVYVKNKGQYQIPICNDDDETRFWIAQEVADTRKDMTQEDYSHRERSLLAKDQ